MNTDRTTGNDATVWSVGRLITTIAITGLGLGTTGLVPALAAGKHPGGHHHEDAHWTAPAEAANRSNPVTVTEQSVNRGKKIYQTNCASCHGAGGEGDGPVGAALKPPAANLKVMAPQHPDGGLAWKIAEGRGAMPPWKSALSETEIWDVVNYIKQLAESGNAHRHDDKHGHEKGDKHK